MAKYIVLLSFLVLCNFGHAVSYKWTPNKGKVTFLAKGRPALISIKGEGEGLSGHLKESKGVLRGAISFRLDSLKTGIDLRDEHLKQKYLEIGKFPEATLHVEDLKIPENLDRPFEFKAVLELHGVKQTVAGSVSVSKDLDDLNLTGSFQLKLTQFLIETPSFQGVAVAEDVQVNIDVPFLKED